jgi:hypothetical protein
MYFTVSRTWSGHGRRWTNYTTSWCTHHLPIINAWGENWMNSPSKTDQCKWTRWERPIRCNPPPVNFCNPPKEKSMIGRSDFKQMGQSALKVNRPKQRFSVWLRAIPLIEWWNGPIQYIACIPFRCPRFATFDFFIWLLTISGEHNNELSLSSRR